MAEQQNPLNNIHTNAFQTLANQTIRNVERINRNRLQTEENNINRELTEIRNNIATITNDLNAFQSGNNPIAQQRHRNRIAVSRQRLQILKDRKIILEENLTALRKEIQLEEIKRTRVKLPNEIIAREIGEYL